MYGKGPNLRVGGEQTIQYLWYERGGGGGEEI